MRVKYWQRTSFLNHLGLESLEGGNRYKCGQCVVLLLGLIIFVTAPRETDADSTGDIPDTLLPDSLVQVFIKTNILGTHHLLGSLADGLDGTRSAVLEGVSVDVLVEVNGEFADDKIWL